MLQIGPAIAFGEMPTMVAANAAASAKYEEV
jgi:hypothetical protein